MLNFIAGSMFGAVLCFLALALCRRGEDCFNCSGIIERDEDIRALTSSRDVLRQRVKQLEVLVHTLRSRNGALTQEVQRIAFLHQKEA